MPNTTRHNRIWVLQLLYRYRFDQLCDVLVTVRSPIGQANFLPPFYTGSEFDWYSSLLFRSSQDITCYQSISHLCLHQIKVPTFFMVWLKLMCDIIYIFMNYLYIVCLIIFHSIYRYDTWVRHKLTHNVSSRKWSFSGMIYFVIDHRQVGTLINRQKLSVKFSSASFYYYIHGTNINIQ